MSDRALLATSGTTLCMLGMGFAFSTVAMVTSGVVIADKLADIYKRCSNRQLRKARDRAETALANLKLPEGANRAQGEKAALGLLREHLKNWKVTPEDFSGWKDDVPAAILKAVIPLEKVPKDDGVPQMLVAVFEEAFVELRKEPEWSAVFVQEQIFALHEEQAKQFAYLKETYGTLAQSLNDLRSLNRRNLEFLAARFRLDLSPEASDDDLVTELGKAAEDFFARSERIDRSPSPTPQIADLKARARAAREDLDFETADSLLAEVVAVEGEIAAEAMKRLDAARETAREAVDDLAASHEERGDMALDANRPEEAFRHFCAAADSFAGIDPLEVAERRDTYCERLCRHGLRYGGAGLALAAGIVRPAIAAITAEAEPERWGRYNGNLGNALQTQGSRTAGPEGAALLAEAVAAYRAALRVFTETNHPVNWAKAMQNLGNALQEQGSRTAGPEGAALLAEAVAAYRAALRVRTEAEHPVNWAATMQNLGNALQTQGIRTAGPEGAALLAEAVAVYRDALRVFTEADHPVHWATTMQNLGIALATQGIRTGGPVGADLLAEAVADYRAALRVRTEADHPVQWAMTRENMALTDLARADHDSCADPRSALEAALGHVEAALTVYDPEHMPYDYGTATKLRDRLKARLAAL